MSCGDVIALEPLDDGGDLMLYDKEHRPVGLYNRETGRGMFAHTFFADEETCRIVETNGSWHFPCHVDDITHKLSCGHVAYGDYDGDFRYCQMCGKKVVGA